MGQIFNDDAAVIDRVVVIGFQNRDFAKRRKRRKSQICLGGLYGFLDVIQPAGEPAFMGGDKAHAHKGRNRIAINFHGGLPSETVQFVNPA